MVVRSEVWFHIKSNVAYISFLPLFLIIMRSALFVVLTAFILIGCRSNVNVRSGAVNVIETQIPEEHLLYTEISEMGIKYSSFFGVQNGNQKSKVTESSSILNFNGQNISTGSSNLKPLQIFTFLLNVGAIALPIIAEDDDQTLLALGLGIIAGGMINESLWSGFNKKNAIGIANNALISNNRNIDFYFNPNYNINSEKRLFKSNYIIDVNAIGVGIKKDLFWYNQKEDSQPGKSVEEIREGVKNRRGE